MPEITFPPGAEDYYDLDEARKFLDSPVPEGFHRWRCILCGFPQGDFMLDHPAYEATGAYCCGGCGMSTVRPIEEYTDFWKNTDSV